MRFLHLADLHIGKKVYEFSMLEDQKYILNQILDIVTEQKIDGVWIAGDVYDKAIPSAEAVRLLDEFIVALSKLSVRVYIISGNHDSAERLSFGGRLMEQAGVHIAAAYDGEVKVVTESDEYGDIHIYMLPFVKPALVRHGLLSRTEEEEAVKEIEKLGSYQEAVSYVCSHLNPDKTVRNVILSHQFVTGAATCDSEELAVGGMENVDAQAYEEFDYVALGHIHGPQKVGRDEVRYCGTPLKYSFSEITHKKSVTVVDLQEKGNIKIEQIPLIPLRDMSVLTGEFATLLSKEFIKEAPVKDYLKICLTDEEEVPNAIARLREVYPYIMHLEYDNSRTRAQAAPLMMTVEKMKQPQELFKEFYEMQNGVELTKEQEAYIEQLVEEIWR